MKLTNALSLCLALLSTGLVPSLAHAAAGAQNSGDYTPPPEHYTPPPEHYTPKPGHGTAGEAETQCKKVRCP
jgi:hypothetical protein